jgi:crotonobetainyl-CoA:carnitine CoA-transferase CaiB-like acyl-CoA transferase
MKPASAALSRFTVLDLSRVRAGPTASRQLADWGANVISIEQPPSAGDAEPLVGPRSGSDFQNLNRNRKSITLNLKHGLGVEALKRLVAKADVVIENFRPQVKKRLGVDYEALSCVNPRIVYASISGFGQDGPYSARPGFDQIAQGMSGLMSITGEPGRTPLRVGIAVGDLSAGLFCAFGVLVALLEREVSGRGQWVHTSLVQALAFMLDFQAARWLMEGKTPRQEGNHHATIAPCGTFRTRDGFINLAVVGDTIWQRFCRALRRTDWLEEADFRSANARIAHRDRLAAAIEAELQGETSTHWVSFFNGHSVPCGPVYGVDELFSDANFDSLGLAQTLDSGGRTAAYVAQPVVLTRTPSSMVSHPPELGEHTDEVLRSVGYSSDDLDRLRREQAV